MIRFHFACVIFTCLCGILCQDIPCFTNWAYSKINGKCYISVTGTANQLAANTTCTNILLNSNSSFTQITPRLSRISTANDVSVLKDQLVSMGNNAPVWMDAQMNTLTGTGTWSDGSSVDLTLFANNFSLQNITSNCLTFQYVFVFTAGAYQVQYYVSSVSCLNNNSFICEHDSKKCDITLLAFQSSSMMMTPNSVAVFSNPYITCLSGYYRPSQLPGVVVAQTTALPINVAYCNGTKDPSLNPGLYNSAWATCQIEQCQAVACPVFTGTLNNVISQIPLANTTAMTSFLFGYTFNVNCLTGYVSNSNNNSNLASVVCQQSLLNIMQGIWAPDNLTPCVPVKCSMPDLLAMIPTYSVIISARNKVTQNKYDVTFQTSSIPLYNNIITIQCNDGTFFPDRTWSKQVICGLLNNSLIQGAWQGYLGTILPLPASCQGVTCQYESIAITPAMNINPYFQMMNSNGVYVNQTQPTGNPYPYQTNLIFFCNSGFSTASGNNSQNLICGPQGNWIPNLTPCITIVPGLNIGNAQHYVPPAIESPSAQNVGVVAIVILVVFLLLIIILDMSTLSRDIKVMIKNVRNLKKHMNKDKKALD